MKKLLALLILPSLGFGGSIGSNYFAVGGGYLNNNIEVSGVDLGFDGFAFGLGANFNAIPLTDDSSYGMDLSISFSQGSDLEGDSVVTSLFNTVVELESSSLIIAAKPYTKFGDNIVFANLGYSYAKNKLSAAGESLSDTDSAFVLGVGTEFEFESISFGPSVNWIFNDNEALANIDLSGAVALNLPF